MILDIASFRTYNTAITNMEVSKEKMSNKYLYNFSDSKYQNITDEKLIEQIRLGDLEAQNF